MTRYTVQCGFASYDAKIVVVDADTLDQALEKAVFEADDGCGWESTDIVGNTFVDAVAQGDDVDLWSDDARHLTIPARFTERGEGPRVIVMVSGGVVQSVSIDGGYARVEVRDYDNHDDAHAKTDADGRRYALADWSNVIPADKAG
jgi:hypothetical protein